MFPEFAGAEIRGGDPGRRADARREVIRNVPRVLQEYIWQDVILRGGTSFLLGAATALSVAYFLRRR